MVRKPVPGISSFSPAPPVAQKQTWNTLTPGRLGSRKREKWSTCYESVGGASVVSHQREEGLPGHEGAEEERLHHLQVKLELKYEINVLRPHKRSEPTQWRSFRDWVCGGPSCHQLKPREETTSVTLPTAFSSACLASMAPSSDPAATTGGFQEDARASETNRLSQPLLRYRGTVHPIFNKRWPGFSRNDITGFTTWLFLHHKLLNKTELVGVQQYVWICDKWRPDWLNKRVETGSNAFKQSRSTGIPLPVSFPHQWFQDFTFSVTRLGLNWLFTVKMGVFSCRYPVALIGGIFINSLPNSSPDPLALAAIPFFKLWISNLPSNSLLH